MHSTNQTLIPIKHGQLCIDFTEIAPINEHEEILMERNNSASARYKTQIGEFISKSIETKSKAKAETQIIAITETLYKT